jgi:hypothetical protein
MAKHEVRQRQPTNRSWPSSMDTPQPIKNTVLADKKLEVTYQIVKEQTGSPAASGQLFS